MRRPTSWPDPEGAARSLDPGVVQDLLLRDAIVSSSSWLLVGAMVVVAEVGPEPRPRTPATGLACQMSRAYSRMVRSVLNLPAMFVEGG